MTSTRKTMSIDDRGARPLTPRELRAWVTLERALRRSPEFVANSPSRREYQVAVALGALIICGLVGLAFVSGVALLLGVLGGLTGSGLVWYFVTTRGRR
jgi:hypothetical protein